MVAGRIRAMRPCRVRCSCSPSTPWSGGRPRGQAGLDGKGCCPPWGGATVLVVYTPHRRLALTKQRFQSFRIWTWAGSKTFLCDCPDKSSSQKVLFPQIAAKCHIWHILIVQKKWQGKGNRKEKFDPLVDTRFQVGSLAGGGGGLDPLLAVKGEIPQPKPENAPYSSYLQQLHSSSQRSSFLDPMTSWVGK